MKWSVGRLRSGDEGAVCAEYVCGTVVAIACALVLRLIVMSPQFVRDLGRPFGLALSSVF